MRVNEGLLDRTVRSFVGLALVGAAATGFLGPWAWVGVIPLITGLVGMCPLYAALGIDTCPTRR